MSPLGIPLVDARVTKMEHNVISIEARIPTQDAILAGTLLSPAIHGPWPCILLITGSGANDRDETVCGHTPFRLIAEHFAADGYAVLRCDDRGVGESTGCARDQDFNSAVADVISACDWLASHPLVDPQRIILFGHSEGGLIAAVAGQHVNAYRVIMLASPAMPIELLLHEQARSVSEESCATLAQIDHEYRMNKQVFALSRSHGEPQVVASEIEEVIRLHLRTWPDIPLMDEATINENARVMSEVVSSPAYRTLLRQDPSDIINRFTGPILAIYGGKDVQVPGRLNMDAFLRITANRDNTAVRFLPDHNHLFQFAVTGSISEYASLLPAPDTKVLREVTAWLISSEQSAGHKSRIVL
jgi:uncharacterized protein